MTKTAQKSDSVFSNHYVPELMNKKTLHPEIKKILDKIYHDLRDFYIAKNPETGQILLTDLPEAKQKAIEALKAFSDNSLRDLGQPNLINSRLSDIYKAASGSDKTFNFEKSLKQYINELESNRRIF